MIGRTNAIASSASGGGSLRVVGGTTRPSNPSENMIWINTSATITSWILCVDEPSSPEEGMVWLVVWKSTDKVLTLDESFTVNLGTARQYISGTWTTMDGGVYINNAWINLRTYLYKEGVFNSRWAFTVPTDSTMYTEESDHLIFKGKNSSRVFWFTNERIDLSNISTINFDVEKIAGGSNTATNFGLTVCYMTSSTTTLINEAEVAETWIGNNKSGAARAVISIDVSSVMGKYYIALVDNAGANVPGGGQMLVYGIELA